MRCQKRKQKRDKYQQPLDALPDDTFFEHKKTVKPLRPLNENQYAFMRSIEINEITFAYGSAGTGKTYIAAAMAADRLLNGAIDRIIITRPGVEAGESFGFLPGTLEEKYAPFVEPFMEVLYKRLGKSHTDYLFKRGKIIARPLSHMRGFTFEDSIVILDEAQNTTINQLKMFLTRIGYNCKIIVDGDVDQIDINGRSGLIDSITRYSHIQKIGFVHFDIDDCVRSPIVKEILKSHQCLTINA